VGGAETERRGGRAQSGFSALAASRTASDLGAGMLAKPEEFLHDRIVRRGAADGAVGREAPFQGEGLREDAGIGRSGAWKRCWAGL